MASTRHFRYACQRLPAEVISHAVWLYFRFSLSLRMVEEMLAARGIGHIERNFAAGQFQGAIVAANFHAAEALTL